MVQAKIIGFLYRNILKPILFIFDPEKIHDLFSTMGKKLGKYTITKKITKWAFYYENKKILSQNILGITFNNPVGLSAGFDKELNLLDIIEDIGFGWEEVGSITALPYDGNKGKRLARLKKSKGLLVYYGLKNKGAEQIKELIKNKKTDYPFFVSVAKTNSKETCDYQKGINDYIKTIELLKDEPFVAGFVINISCPNAFGGEDYTSPQRLTGLLQAIQQLQVHKPIFVKIPVDVTPQEAKLLAEVCTMYGVSGIIIANLTKIRDKIHPQDKEKIKNMEGGISGKPTQDKSNILIGEIFRLFGDKLIIVGVGGIFSPEDAYEKIKQGASLVELITGMIFQGPQLIGEINRGLVKLLEKDGYKNISEAIGVNHKK